MLGTISSDDVQRYGGKGAILNRISERCPSLVPPYEYKHYEDGMDAALQAFERLKKPVVVRSSSPHEYGDFEGIFASVRNVYDRGTLERAVRTVEESAQSELAQEYARQNGFKIDEKMQVIIHEQSPSEWIGAMIRHPNNPYMFIAQCFDDVDMPALAGSNIGRNYKLREARKKELCAEDEYEISHDIPDELTRRLIQSYEQIEGCGIAPGYSLFVEFAYEPFAILQARPFKRIETADFEVPRRDSSKYKTLFKVFDKKTQNDERRGGHTIQECRNVIRSDTCFGITPPDGVVLPVLKSFGTMDLLGIALSANISRDSSKMDSVLRGLDVHLGLNACNAIAAASLDAKLSGRHIMENYLQEHCHERKKCWGSLTVS